MSLLQCGRCLRSVACCQAHPVLLTMLCEKPVTSHCRSALRGCRREPRFRCRNSLRAAVSRPFAGTVLDSIVPGSLAKRRPVAEEVTTRAAWHSVPETRRLHSSLFQPSSVILTVHKPLWTGLEVAATVVIVLQHIQCSMGTLSMCARATSFPGFSQRYTQG